MGPHCGLSLRGCFVQTCPFVLLILLHTVHSILRHAFALMLTRPDHSRPRPSYNAKARDINEVMKFCLFE